MILQLTLKKIILHVYTYQIGSMDMSCLPKNKVVK